MRIHVTDLQEGLSQESRCLPQEGSLLLHLSPLARHSDSSCFSHCHSLLAFSLLDPSPTPET